MRFFFIDSYGRGGGVGRGLGVSCGLGVGEGLAVDVVVGVGDPGASHDGVARRGKVAADSAIKDHQARAAPRTIVVNAAALPIGVIAAERAIVDRQRGMIVV